MNIESCVLGVGRKEERRKEKETLKMVAVEHDDDEC
jgi:hypothetical protein